MNNSREAIVLRDLNRVRSSLRSDLLNGKISPDDYESRHYGLINRIRLALVMDDLSQVVCEVLNEQESEIVNHLAVVARHRNSVVFQGGDFDLYLSLQNLGGTLPQSSDWGTL
jgi:hypothetical protein